MTGPSPPMRTRLEGPAPEGRARRRARGCAQPVGALELGVDLEEAQDDGVVVADENALGRIGHGGPSLSSGPSRPTHRATEHALGLTARAPVAQGIEHAPPERGAQVRILPG